ncbi:MAG: OmpA family protein [Candidatus Magnetoovum sp. WYHC-5]|nr:OmpA family protein [Candidatus Magnetoovum sp. WYHC-5]
MKGQNIIIKKRKKQAHQGGHGGSWKVAYADFVTAMMAFFLLMWLVTMTSPKKKLSLKNYFQNVTVFEQMGISFMDYGAAPFDNTITDTEDIIDLPRGGTAFALAKEMIKEKFVKEIEKKLSDVKDQVLVDVFEEGVRIQIVDKEGKPMFPVGSSELTEKARSIIKVIGEGINDLTDAKIAVEGHTDALKYAGKQYTNWELSTSRASAARLELEKNGIMPNNIKKVSGYADTEPLVKENPLDPRNRRISILIYTSIQSIQRTPLTNIEELKLEGGGSGGSNSGSRAVNGYGAGNSKPNHSNGSVVPKQFFMK